MEEKIANHACMNERFFLEFHMARSHIEMKQSVIEMALKSIISFFNLRNRYLQFLLL